MRADNEAAPRERALAFRRREGARPFVLGHRGARHAAPENTFAAFDLALREGADGIELDVRLDGSREVVVIHDVDLARVSEGRSTARVEKLETAALTRIDVGKGERVPLLADVLAWASEKNAMVNVEAKADVRDRPKLHERVVEVLERFPRAADLVLLSSFHPVFVRDFARRLPHVPVCWLVHERQAVLRFAPGWRALGADGVNPEHTLLSAAAVRRLRAAGALVNTWTVNDPVLAPAYAVFGVDSIITDAPGKILSALERRPG